MTRTVLISVGPKINTDKYCPSLTHSLRSDIRFLACILLYLNLKIINANICPRGSDPLYIVSYYIKWVTTSWTHSILQIFPGFLFSPFYTPFFCFHIFTFTLQLQFLPFNNFQKFDFLRHFVRSTAAANFKLFSTKIPVYQYLRA